MRKGRIRESFSQPMAALILIVAIGAVLPIRAQAKPSILWLAPSLAVWGLWVPRPNEWVKCAKTGVVTDQGVKLLIATELGHECTRILRNSREFGCTNSRDSIIMPMSTGQCINVLQEADSGWRQPKVSVENWFWRLEEPLGALGWNLGDFLRRLDSGTEVSGGDSQVNQDLETMRGKVENIVRWTGDIWHIDLNVDGHAAQIVESLWKKARTPLLLHDESVSQPSTCPQEAGDISYTVDEDGLSARMERVTSNEGSVEIYQFDSSNEGHVRKRCIRFGQLQDAVGAVEILAANVEEGLGSDAQLWDAMRIRRIRRMVKGMKSRAPIIENKGLREDLYFHSTLDKRPYRTLTVENTGETIELWIVGANGGVFVKVRWVNLPAT